MIDFVWTNRSSFVGYVMFVWAWCALRPYKQIKYHLAFPIYSYDWLNDGTKRTKNINLKCHPSYDVVRLMSFHVDEREFEAIELYFTCSLQVAFWFCLDITLSINYMCQMVNCIQWIFLRNRMFTYTIYIASVHKPIRIILFNCVVFVSCCIRLL